MTATLRNIGDDLALVFDRKTLGELGIDEQTPLEVSMDATGIHIRAIPNDYSAQVRAIAFKLMEIHDETLRELAL